MCGNRRTNMMSRPLDSVEMGGTIQIEAMYTDSVLYIERVRHQTTRIAWQQPVTLCFVNQVAVREIEVRHVVLRLLTVERPDEIIFFLGREFEQPCAPGHRVPHHGARTGAFPVEIPEVESAAQRVAFHVTATEIRAHVRTISAQDLRNTVLAAHDDDAPVQKIHPDDFALADLVAHAYGVPALTESSLALGRKGCRFTSGAPQVCRLVRLKVRQCQRHLYHPQ